MRIFFNAWASAGLAPALVNKINAVSMPRTSFMRKTFQLIFYCCCELFSQLLERFFDVRIVDKIARRWNLFALISSLFCPQVHGLVEGNLADQAVSRKGLKILHEVFVVVLGALPRRF